MSNGYMPRPDLLAMQWMTVFANGLLARPGVFKVSPADAAMVHQAVQAFVAAMSISAAPTTRTPSAIVTKDGTRVQAELASRPFYLRIKYDPTISDADKIDIGVKPVNASRTRIGTPADAPTLFVRLTPTQAHEIRFLIGGSEQLAKPVGTVGLQLYRQISDSPEGTSDHPAEYLGTFTRSPIVISYSPNDDLKFATYAARWTTRRGRNGPFSAGVTARIVSRYGPMNIESRNRANAA